jgi:manganese oxidase
LRPGDYRDPGWYPHPKGSVAYEWTGDPPAATRAPVPETKPGIELKARKPSGHSGH